MPARERAIKSDLSRVDRLRDQEINYSDTSELDGDVFAQPPVARERLRPKTRIRPKATRCSRPSRRPR
jgi:hypothetical protein